ncbi:MAG TPA: hypothetical protein VF785_13855 [Gemmatimonadaceae bacterium]
MDTRDTNPTPNDHKIRSHDDTVTAGKLASEGVGGAAAGAAGAAIGAMAGPIGMLVGGIAGIVGGWWAGKSAAEAAGSYSDADDRHYRETYENAPNRIADRSYDDVRPAYQLGHVAGMNPDYRNRDWNAVEGDLQHGWNDDVRAKHGEWDAARPFARDAFTRSRAAAAGSTAAGAVREAGHKAANAVDDLKDRVDGNPESRPGPDPTDRPERLR